MKKSTLMIVAITACVLASCAKADLNEIDTNKSLTAYVQDTKTSLEGITVKWSEGDQIQVFTNSDKEWYNIAAGVGTNKGSFTPTDGHFKLAEGVLVGYPAKEMGGYAENGKFEFEKGDQPKLLNQSSSKNPAMYLPMYGQISQKDDKYAVELNHINGILRLKIAAGDKNVTKIVVGIIGMKWKATYSADGLSWGKPFVSGSINYTCDESGDFVADIVTPPTDNVQVIIYYNSGNSKTYTKSVNIQSGHILPVNITL